MRGVDNQRAAVGEYRFEFVHHLSRRPDIVVHLRCNTENRMIGLVLVNNMDVPGQIRRLSPGLGALADEYSLELVPHSHDGE